MKTAAAIFTALTISVLGTGCLPECTELSFDAEGEVRCRIPVGEVDREVLIHLPPGQDPGQPKPVVFSFHGRLGNAQQHAELTQWPQKGEKEGFIVVHPEGHEASWNAGGCCGKAQEEEAKDVELVTAILAALTQNAGVDEGRVYATGFSNGARMTYRLACQMSEVFAAVAPVGGTLSNLNMETGEELWPCNPGNAISLMHIHGTDDTCNPFEGGDGKDTKNNRSVDDMASIFENKNGCNEQDKTVDEVGDTTCVRWNDCAAGGAILEFCDVNGGGHIYPGGEPYVGWKTCGGEWIDDINATDRIWDFFQDHPAP
jgi:polyhydroxybutyrate depolymerase